MFNLDPYTSAAVIVFHLRLISYGRFLLLKLSRRYYNVMTSDNKALTEKSDIYFFQAVTNIWAYLCVTAFYYVIPLQADKAYTRSFLILLLSLVTEHYSRLF